jgi:hypothetical protein
MERDPKAPARRERALRKDAKRAELARHLWPEHARWLVRNGLSHENLTPPWRLGKGYWAFLEAEIRCHGPNRVVPVRATVKRDDDIWRAQVEASYPYPDRTHIWTDPEEHCSALMAQYACIDWIAERWSEDVAKALSQPYTRLPDPGITCLLAFLREHPMSQLEIDRAWEQR